MGVEVVQCYTVFITKSNCLILIKGIIQSSGRNSIVGINQLSASQLCYFLGII